MNDYERFFKRFEDYSIIAIFYENRQGFGIEELYQAFKLRYEAEKEGNQPLEEPKSD